MGTIYAAVSKGEGRRLERRKKALEGREKMFAYREGGGALSLMMYTMCSSER